MFSIRTSPYNSNRGIINWESDTKAIVYGGSVVDKDGTIYVCNTSGSILAISKDGILLWSKVIQTFKPSWAPTPAIGANGILYVTIDGEKVDAGGFTIPNTALIAMKKNDGTELWRWKVLTISVCKVLFVQQILRVNGLCMVMITIQILVLIFILHHLVLLILLIVFIR